MDLSIRFATLRNRTHASTSIADPRPQEPPSVNHLRTDPTAPDRRWLVLVLVCIAQFMVVLDATVVNVALPSIQADLDFSASSLQWVVNAYTLAFGGFLLLGGRAADFIGRRRLFVAGVVVFTVASLLNGLATSSECAHRRPAPCRAWAPRWSRRPPCRS